MIADTVLNHNEHAPKEIPWRDNVHNEVLFQSSFGPGDNFSLFVFVVLVVSVVVRLFFSESRQ